MTNGNERMTIWHMCDVMKWWWSQPMMIMILMIIMKDDSNGVLMMIVMKWPMCRKRYNDEWK